MRKKVLTFVILLVLLTSNLSHASDPTKNYELQSVWGKPAQYLIPMDVNAQTPGEELVGIYGNQVDVVTATSQTHQKSIIVPFDKPYFITPLPGVSPDSLRLLFRHQTSTTAAYNLYLYDGDSLLLIRENCLFFSGQDRDLDGKFHQSIIPVGLFRDRKNNRNILLRVDSGGDAGTRGLIAIDPSTGIESWRYLAGPQICYCKIVDLENDGLQEIVFGSYAPDNKVKLNGTRDDSCYVFVIDDLGNER